MYEHMLASLLDAYAHAADTNTYFSPMLLENPCDSTHAAPAEQTCRTKKNKLGGGGGGVLLNKR